MGWDYHCEPSRLKDFLKERTEGWDGTNAETLERSVTKCLTSKYVMYNPGRGTLWKVMESTRYTQFGTVISGPERWIGVDLIACHNRCWGHKSMEASSGPNEINCPIKYLDMVPEPLPCKNQPECPKEQFGTNACKCGGCHGCSRCYERNWRTKVRAAHAVLAKRKQFIRGLQVGDILVIAPGYTIASGTQLKVIQLKPKLLAGSEQGYAHGNMVIKPKHIDVEASLAVVGIDKEAI
jgi:hypothetical protein